MKNKSIRKNLINGKKETTDFIKRGTKIIKILAQSIKNKSVVFFSGMTYEAKGYAYNTYDKARFIIAEKLKERKVDIVRYRGEKEPKTGETAKRVILSKINRIKSKMPGSASEARDIVAGFKKSTGRRARRVRLSAKHACIEGFERTKESVAGIKRSTVVGLSAIAVFGIVLTFSLMTVVDSYAMGVTINGERVGFVENEEKFAAMVKNVEKEISSENHNADIQINEDLIKLDSMAESKADVELIDEGTLKETVLDSNAISVTASAVYVDGKSVLYVGNKEDANTVLDEIKNKFSVSGQDVITEFRQDVEVKDEAVNVQELMPTKNAITYLLTGNETIKKYKVKEDDTDWDIAQKFNLTEKDIQKSNPSMDTKVIKEGDILNISKMEPFVQMEVIATVNVKEKINYKTKKVETDDLYIGETKVIKDGKRGESTVTKRAVYLNGKEERAHLIEKQIIKKPKNKVVLVGTKEKPAESSNSYQQSNSGSSYGSSVYKSGGSSYVSGSGKLSNPMRRMQISSPFGPRGGRMHSGVDLRNPSGTPIYAAASGKVTYSGYDGAYGNTVRISHGNGMVTVYAHCNSLYVRSGASVSKGKQIATVGRTGRATGYHLHFEVRINGSARNPMGYL